MPYLYENRHNRTSYALPIKMSEEDPNLPDYYYVGRRRPYILSCRMSNGRYDDCHRYMLDAENDQEYSCPAGITWLQQCWYLPDMTIKADRPNLMSELGENPKEMFFSAGYPYAYEHPMNPTSLYKYVRSGNYTYDVAGFGEVLTNGWGGYGVNWTDGKSAANIYVNIKRIASYLSDRSNLPANHNYCRIVIDFIGMNNVSHNESSFNNVGNFGFLRDSYSVYTGGGVSYHDPIQLCGDVTYGYGSCLGNWMYTRPNGVYGYTYPLHVNMTGFNINTIANDSAESIYWNFLPVATSDRIAWLPRRACLRISVVTAPSTPYTPVT